MNRSRHVVRRATLATISVATVALLVAIVGSAQAATRIDLGTADSFVVLASTGVTNTGATTLGGDLGSFPNGSVTGAESITFASGTNYADGGPTANAKLDLVTAYDNAVGQGPTIPITADLVGLTLVPGVYNSGSTIQLSGALTLDAQNDPNAVWIFQAGSSLIVGEGATVNLTNGAQACNVFWQVTSSATLGTSASFAGTIMAQESITLNTSATLQGRALARNGTVTLDTNRITRPVCSTPPETPPGETPPGETPPGETPPGETPPGETPPGETPPGETPPGGTPPGGTPPGGGTPGTGTTTGQVTGVPSGSVAAGDGSTSTGSDSGRYLLMAGLVVAGVGVAASVVGWRSRRDEA